MPQIDNMYFLWIFLPIYLKFYVIVKKKYQREDNVCVFSVIWIFFLSSEMILIMFQYYQF